VSQLSRVRRIYDRDPAAYHRGSVLTERLLAARRRKVGEIVTGRVLDIGYGTGLSLPHHPPSLNVFGIDASLGMLQFGRCWLWGFFNLIVGWAPGSQSLLTGRV
jgi:SAM-dependent methyltransferase